MVSIKRLIKIIPSCKELRKVLRKAKIDTKVRDLIKFTKLKNIGKNIGLFANH